MTDILDKNTPQSHLAADIPTRGTSVVVGAAISENEILDVDVPPGEWDDVMDKVKARSIDLPASVFKGRDPKSIRVLRFVCSNHPRLSVGVEFHGEDGSGACSYFLDRTSPPPQ